MRGRVCLSQRAPSAEGSVRIEIQDTERNPYEGLSPDE